MFLMHSSFPRKTGTQTIGLESFLGNVRLAMINQLTSLPLKVGFVELAENIAVSTVVYYWLCMQKNSQKR